MAWNDPRETIVAGTGQVYSGAVGTAEPANAESALNNAYAGLGFHTEDGVSTNASPEMIEHRAWQSKYPIRIDRQSEDFTLTFALLQHNEVNYPVAFGGGEVVDLGGGQIRYNPPTPYDAPYERTIICDVVDGDRIGRFVIPKGIAVEGVETQFAREAMAALPITIRALEPDDGSVAWYLLTNDDAAFAAGS